MGYRSLGPELSADTLPLLAAPTASLQWDLGLGVQASFDGQLGLQGELQSRWRLGQWGSGFNAGASFAERSEAIPGPGLTVGEARIWAGWILLVGERCERLGPLRGCAEVAVGPELVLGRAEGPSLFEIQAASLQTGLRVDLGARFFAPAWEGWSPYVGLSLQSRPLTPSFPVVGVERPSSLPAMAGTLSLGVEGALMAGGGDE